MDLMVKVRPETPGDKDGVFKVNAAAFGTEAEARLVDRLHNEADAVISLVAELDGNIVGHILFSPVTLAGNAVFIQGLAPMAVRPGCQNNGVGSALVHAGLEACKAQGAGAVVVLGHPNYYPRFGFVPASRFGLSSEYEVPDEVFMVLELEPGYLAGINGKVSYHPAFGDL